ncbi:hypothetical protein [Paraburkholderia diazotrophica]|uniref:Signal recognition particle subunit FFH/SRP54 (Srp54) n=1 Tax=Paraburkholderia diazotrophica TaxID=667676 RepID=A0A1H7C1X2_9BURK|nr:hypothetical protein [Paraburkholderia diazotrophica]SEJ83648.1 hypothetical protein SAMN05192539_10207 [Paraburkholderia diazotrophica]
MKKLVFAIALCSALTSPMLLAASKDTTRAQSSSKSQSPNTAAFDRNLVQTQEQMKIMQAQMDQIRKTKDPQERQKLLRQHWATMQSAMNAMHGMWGPGMMGYGGMGPGMMGGWGHMGGYYSQLTPEQLKERQYMTDQYLRMQQEMMNNMMWQQQYWMAPPTSPQ